MLDCLIFIHLTLGNNNVSCVAPAMLNTIMQLSTRGTRTRKAAYPHINAITP